MNVPVFINKVLSPLISLTISMLFNNSLSEGIFDKCFKTALKLFQYLTLVNYRPFSVLPFLSKIFEKLMCARLDSYLKSNNILCTNQFGFPKNWITSDAIIEFLDYVYSSLDSKEQHCNISRFSKAFDTVNHNILISKLLHNGIRGVMHNWFEYYLSNRKQFI